MNTDQAIIELLKIVKSLNEKYNHKSFTLDGRLVGDLGEVIAEDNYKLKLHDRIKAKYDGKTEDGRDVQIKATFKNSLGFPCNEKNVPDIYLGIKIFEDGRFEEIYNGPGNLIWEYIKTRKVPKNNLYAVSIAKLIEINKNVLEEQRITRRK